MSHRELTTSEKAQFRGSLVLGFLAVSAGGTSLILNKIVTPFLSSAYLAVALVSVFIGLGALLYAASFMLDLENPVPRAKRADQSFGTTKTTYEHLLSEACSHVIRSRKNASQGGARGRGAAPDTASHSLVVDRRPRKDEKSGPRM